MKSFLVLYSIFLPLHLLVKSLLEVQKVMVMDYVGSALTSQLAHSCLFFCALDRAVGGTDRPKMKLG